MECNPCLPRSQECYDAWGNITGQSGSLAGSNPYRYAGYWYDAETGLYYLKARYYRPDIGRFISQDAWKGDRSAPLTQNLQAYGVNTPTKFVDPSGNRPAAFDDECLTCLGAWYEWHPKLKQNPVKVVAAFYGVILGGALLAEVAVAIEGSASAIAEELPILKDFEGLPRVRLLAKGTQLTRVFGGNAGIRGGYFLEALPESEEVFRNTMAVGSWNSAQYYAVFETTKTTLAWVGRVASVGALTGGGTQVWLSPTARETLNTVAAGVMDWLSK